MPGKKIGLWKYYGDDGVLTSAENYHSGETRVYKKGVQAEYFFLKNDEIDGVAELYNACGALREKLVYANGKRQGKVTAYFTSGKVSQEYTYDNDQLTGPFTNYYETGTVRNKSTYALGKTEGVFTEYFANGKAAAQGSYKTGEANGVWKYYHANGRLSRTGNFTNGTATGDWIFYDVRGNLYGKRTLNEKGSIVGEDYTYHDGKPYYTETYKNDLLVKVTYYEKAGKVIGTFGKSDGTFPVKFYYPTGQLFADGHYKKGRRDGHWKYYFPEGTVKAKRPIRMARRRENPSRIFTPAKKCMFRTTRMTSWKVNTTNILCTAN